MDGLTEGRVVHFVAEDGKHHPADVARVLNGKTGEIILFVKDGDKRETFFVKAVFAEVGNHEKATPNSWHWIEKA